MVFMVTKRDKWQWAAVLIAACILTYANGLGGGFTYDDKAIVRDNPRIRSPGSVPQIFATSYFGGPRGAGTVYRPLLLLSYAVQWWIHGRQAVAFHAVNVLLHAGATLLLAALLLRIAIPSAVAFSGALLFAVAPIHVEAVTSLVGRGEVLAAVFTLIYLHMALRHLSLPPAATSPSLSGLRRTRRFPALLAALLCYALAVLTKESGSSAPALALLLFVFVEEGKLRERLRRAFVRGLPLLCGSGAALAGVFLLRRWVLGGFLKSPGTGIFEVENALFPIDPLSRAVNACVILFRYLGRTVFPLHLSADESAWSIEVVSGKLPLASGSGIPLLLPGVLAGVEPYFPDRNDLRRAARVSAERRPVSGRGGSHCGKREEPAGAHAAAVAAPGGGRRASGRANDRAQFRLVERRRSLLESCPDSAREREGSLRHRLHLGGRAAVFARPRAVRTGDGNLRGLLGRVGGQGKSGEGDGTPVRRRGFLRERDRGQSPVREWLLRPGLVREARGDP